MEYLIVAVFFIGYLFITVEHQVKIDKTISALGMAVVCWTILKVADLPIFEKKCIFAWILPKQLISSYDTKFQIPHSY